MAINSVSGRPLESDDEPDIDDLKADFLETKRGQNGVPFDDAFCLAKIPRQPEEYDGPDRYCSRWTCQDRDDFCPHHRHFRHVSETDNPTGNLKHGIYSLRSTLKADFDEMEMQAYNQVVEEWEDYYGLDDKSDRETLSSLAIELIREVRADAILADDGLVHFRTQYDASGQPAGDEPEAHYLASERRSIRSSIEKMKRNLGITRKHRDQLEVESEKADQIGGLMDAVNESIEDADRSYDPDADYE